MSVLPIGISGEGQYTISRSLRFNSADSASLTRTPTADGNNNRWTFSFWMKYSQQNAANNPTILGLTGDGTGTDAIALTTSYGLTINCNTGSLYQLNTTRVFRDPSAWYHVIVAADVTNATAAHRIRVYINGVEETAFSTDNRSTLPNNAFSFNKQFLHAIGNNPAVSRYFAGLLAEIYMIDGQQLTPSSFGETDLITGVWKPKKYTGTYGTNGFYLNFSDNSGTTSTTLGKDSSGNGNNWTPNNFSVTAGAGNDSLVDTPTPYGSDTGVGGEVRGNYATLNPIQNPPSGAVSTAYSNGNLQTVLDSSVARSTFAPASGKWYAEFVITSATLSTDTRFAVEPSSGNTFSGNAGQGRAYSANGNKVFNGTSTAYGSTWTQNDIIGCALDLDNGKVWWSKNGTWQASGDPAAGTNEAFSGLSGEFNFTIVNGNSAVSKTFVANFGQRPFAFSAPSGFKSLVTTNLP